MKSPRLILALTLFTPAVAPARTPPLTAPQLRAEKYGNDRGMTCPLNILPGQSLGSIRIGQSRAEVAALGLPRRTVPTYAPGEIHGRYEVLFLDDRVIGIDLPLAVAPDCLRYRGNAIARKSSLAEWRAILPRCLPEESRIGGNITVCAGVELARGGWGGEQGLTLRVRRPENLSEAKTWRPPPELEEILRPFREKHP